MTRLDARWQHFWARGKTYRRFWQSAEQNGAAASGDMGTVRFAGGAPFTRSRPTALGATIVVGTSIIPGKATVGHEITVNGADGTSHIVTIFGATDKELCDDDFMMAVVTGDWDPWLLKQREAA